MAPLRKRRCAIAVALVMEIVVFSIVTFVIAYLSSTNAIHHASQQLADSMADTVALRVMAEMHQTERATQVLASAYARNRPQSRMLPVDTAELPLQSSSRWSAEWIAELRALMVQSASTSAAYV